MKPAELKAIRKKIGVPQVELAYQMGYSGNQNTMHTMIKRFENGKREPIPLNFARYVWLLGLVCSGEPVPMNDDGLPAWPEWPGYEEPR